MKVFLDTNIPMYAAGKEHPLKSSCLEILESVAEGKLTACTDSEVFQEILYRFFHIKQPALGYRVFDLFAMVMHGSVYPVSYGDVSLARQFSESGNYPGLSPRDLIHLAVMLNNNIRHIITADRSFEHIQGIRVIRP
ncbi:MAG: type II toxin-antitoxin system VapC family toxin [Bacillota bacterium]|nr:type II toxin-antitoxin system VapC family toxin [Bacillota bacterium]MDW7684251.1 type II toxin-antitoxin system VapC family toxin [Bacillota bacterium]